MCQCDDLSFCGVGGGGVGMVLVGKGWGGGRGGGRGEGGGIVVGYVSMSFATRHVLSMLLLWFHGV